MVRELLDKRSTTTSDRPPLYFAKLVTGGRNMGFIPYSTLLYCTVGVMSCELKSMPSDNLYKNMRRALMNILTKDACEGHVPIQQAETSQLMYDLLKQPQVRYTPELYASVTESCSKAYFTLVERFSISNVLAITFGIRAPRHDSKLVQQFCNLEHDWEDLIAPGHHPPVDLLPILRYVPERWAKWKGVCREMRVRQDGYYFGLLDSCDVRMQKEKQNGCFMEHILQEKEKFGLTREAVAYVFESSDYKDLPILIQHMRTLVMSARPLFPGDLSPRLHSCVRSYAVSPPTLRRYNEHMKKLTVL